MEPEYTWSRSAASDHLRLSGRCVRPDIRRMHSRLIRLLALASDNCTLGGVFRVQQLFPAKGLVTDIECEARDRQQLEKLIAALRAKGYAVSQVELN